MIYSYKSCEGTSACSVEPGETTGSGTYCLKFPTDSDLGAMDDNQQKEMFSFDKVYDPNSTQEQVKQ